MNMNDFYYFRSLHLRSSFQVTAIKLGLDMKDSSFHSSLIKSKYEGINFPVIYKQKSKGKFTDILNTGWISLYLISDKLKMLLEENCFTGWKTYPIILKDKEENQIKGYHGFSITGKAGCISYTNSPIIEKRLIESGPVVKLYKGAHVDLNEWSGCDFFVPEGTIGIVITRKVAEALERNKITNLSLDNLAEVEMSVRLAGLIN